MNNSVQFLSMIGMNLLPPTYFSRLRHINPSSLKVEADLSYYTKYKASIFPPQRPKKEEEEEKKKKK
jgi:hypothetical protein